MMVSGKALYEYISTPCGYLFLHYNKETNLILLKISFEEKYSFFLIFLFFRIIFKSTWNPKFLKYRN